MLSCGMSCVKYLLFSFNLLFVLCGIVIVTFAGFALTCFTYYGLFFGGSAFVGCMLLVTVGAIVFIVAFFGCCGALKENRCMVITFSVLLFMVFALEIGVGITGYVLQDVVKDDVHHLLNSTLFKYEDNEDIKMSWDNLQIYFQCCGINGPDDWAEAHLKIPASCCYYTSDWIFSLETYQTGCMESLEKFFSHHAVVVACVGVGIAFVQLVGMILSCSLAESMRKGYRTMYDVLV